MSSGGSKTKSTTQVVLSPEQNETMQLAMPFLRDFAANPPSAPTGSIYPGFNATQTGAQSAALSAAKGPMADAANQASQVGSFLSNDVLHPESNPALQSYLDAAVRPIFDSLTEQVMPNLRNEFVGAGQYGGSRQGIAEGLASKGASRAAGETTARITSDAYQSGLDAMTRGLALAPGTQAMHAAGPQLQAAVGDTQYALSQAKAQEAFQQKQLADFWNLILAQELMGTSAMIPGGGTSSVSKMPGASPLSQIAGGAAAGLGLAGGLSGGAAINNNLLPLFGFI